MAQQTINIGAVANDGTGDAIRDAFDKANDNFTELYGADTSLDGRLDALEALSAGSRLTSLEGDRIASTTFAALPAAAGASGKVYLVTDVGVAGSLWRSDGTLWRPVHPVVLGRSGVAVSHTGNTSETVLATVAIPANVLGTNRTLEVDAVWSFTGSTNSKTCRARFGAAGSGASGTIVLSGATTTAANVSFRGNNRITGRGSTSSQVGAGNVPVTGFGNGAVITPAIDTTAASEIAFTGLLASSGETITLERYSVTLSN
jgi:hypothetical protein